MYFINKNGSIGVVDLVDGVGYVDFKSLVLISGPSTEISDFPASPNGDIGNWRRVQFFFNSSVDMLLLPLKADA